MIDELHIRDLGVIANSRLPLGPGFTAITGETGAGKTMVVTALGLLMGQRSDAGAVRTGAAQARVTGIIRTQDPLVAELVDDVGGEIEDGELVLGRTVSAEGRSRASVGGSTAPVGTLTKLADRLFAVHGQSEQLRLKSAAAQRDTLDRFGGGELERALDQYRVAYALRRELAHSHEELALARAEREREAARLRAEIDEISAVEPIPGEDVELAQKIERLGNVEELRAAALAAHEALTSESDDPFRRDAAGLLAEAEHELDRVAGHDPRLADLLEAVRAIGFQLQDAAGTLSGYVSDLDEEGPSELARANERFASLSTLTRKYGGNAAEVVAYADAGSTRLLELDGDDDRLEDLAVQLADAEGRLDELAAALTGLRKAAAAQLGTLVSAELRQLALPDAEFRAEVNPAERGYSGADDVQLLLRPHPGAEPRPIAKGASGGELSRVMLALEVVIAGVDPVPTFVFDEVDAGVGGAAAIEIGRRLARLARTSQVIVVTHLAQVAAFAGNHLQVAKDSAGGFTESSCRALTGDDRLAEMARLLSGISDSKSALEHAAELLALREQK